jgi:predicted DNA-binding transcriptional regulator AlpA
MTAPEPYLTAREVAGRLGLTPATVLRYHRQGRLPGRKMPGTFRPIRFVWSEIERAWGAES